MTKNETPRVVVTEADRQAANHWLYSPELLLPEAFARHRQSAEAASRAEVERLREAVKRHLKWLNNLPIPTTGCTAQMIELRAALSASDGEGV